MRRLTAGTLATALLMFPPSEADARSSSLRVSEAGASSASTSASISGRRYAAEAGESLEVMLTDGTSVVLGAGGSLTVARYSLSGSGGEAVLRLGPGTYRVSAGALGRRGRLTVLAGGGQIMVGDATMVVTVGRDGSFSAYMTVGGSAVVQAGGCTRRLSRPGFAVESVAGGCPSRAVRVSSARVAADRAALRPARRVAGGASTGQEDEGDAEPFVPAAAESETAFIDDPQLSERFAIAESVFGDAIPREEMPQGNPPTDRGGSPQPEIEPALDRSYQTALLVAPGIGVTSPSLPNLGGNNGSSANGVLFVDVFDDEDVLEEIASEEGELTLERIAEIAELDVGTLVDLVVSRVAAEIVEVLDGSTSALIGSSASGTLSFPRNLVQQRLSSSGSDLDYFWTFDASGVFTEQYAIDDGGVEVTVAEDQFTVIFSFLSTADPEGIGGLQIGLQSAPFSEEGSAQGTQALSFHAGFPTADANDGDRVDGDAFVIHHFLERQDSAVSQAGNSFVFAGGSLDSGFEALDAVRVDRHASTFGLLGFEDEGEAFPDFEYRRTFLPAESAFADENTLPIELHDSGILLAYQSGLGEPRAQLLHGDAGFEGSGRAQKSTLSISIGDVRRDGATLPRLTGHTFGSSRDSGEGVGSTLFSSPLVSTTVGGSNPQIPVTGTPGYLVVENTGGPNDLQGGDIRPLRRLDDTPEPDFLILRLLAATGSASADGTTGDEPPTVDFDSRTSSTLSGYAAGLAEAQVGNGSQIAPTFADAFAGGYAPNLSISTDADINRLSASLVLSGPEGGANAVALGGLDAGEGALGAYVDDLTFGARTAPESGGLGYALASAALVTREIAGAGDETQRELVGLGTVREYSHMKWGVFLGDRIWDPGTGRREHIHIGSWTAGESAEPSFYRDFTGSATYTGHAIGNAFDGTSVYTALGSYTNTWNFGDRDGLGSGNVMMSFDGKEYIGATTFKPDRGFVSTDLSAAERIGRIDGDFYGYAPGEASPKGVGGQFAISNTPGDGVYRASGTFAAERP